MTDQRVGHTAAFFDVDGTITKTNIVIYYVAIATDGLNPVVKALWYLQFGAKVLLYLAVDKISRRMFNILFYRNYKGWQIEIVQERAGRCFDTITKPRIFPEALKCIEEHQASGDTLVLATGTLDLIAQPLADLLGIDHVISVSLEETGGSYTGRLTGQPISEGQKAQAVEKFAHEHDIDLSASYGYGDSIADLAMLECVGHRVAVAPEKGLEKIAISRGWRILRWKLEENTG